MKSNKGFTVVELLIVVAVLIAASVLFFMQKSAIETASRDSLRKTSINAMHYALEEVYFAKNASYPRTISSENLPSVDPELFKDPQGIAISDGESNFHYEAADCTENACRTYTLRTILENEDDFIKESRNN